MNKSDLARELKRHTSAKSPSRYVRVRTGRARRQAEVIASWQLADMDADQIAAEIYEAISNAGLSPGEQAWAEVLEVGGRSPVGTVAIPRAEVVDPDGLDAAGASPMGDLGSALAAADTPGALVLGLVSAIVSTNGQLAAMLSAERGRSQDVMVRLIDVAGRATAAETLLSWIEQHGTGDDSDGFNKAIEVLGPTLGPALAQMASGIASNMRAKRGGDAAPETPEQRADRLLGELVEVPMDVWMQPGRVERVEAGVMMLSTALAAHKGAR